jgi:hypothetical protein
LRLWNLDEVAEHRADRSDDALEAIENVRLAPRTVA